MRRCRHSSSGGGPLPVEDLFAPEEKLLRRVAREFFRNEIAPLVAQTYTKEGHGVWPEEAVARLQAGGWLGLPIPERYGGAGLGEMGYAICMEEISRFDSSLSTIAGAHTGIGMQPMYLFGNEEQRERYVRPLASGKALAAFALTEPTAGSDAAHIRTKAVKDGSDWVLNGTKIWCSNGDRADYLTVMAVSDEALGAHGGVTAFIVESGFDGFKVGTIEDKMGIRSSSTAELVFEDCRVPRENVLGDVGAGFIVALTALDGGRAGLAAGCLGAMKQLLSDTLAFTRNLRRGGRPVADHQSVQWKLADLATDIYLLEYAVYDAVRLVDRYYEAIAAGKKAPRALREEVSRKAAMLKVAASEKCGEAVEACIEIYGAAGVLDHYGLERGFRDQIITEIYEGTNEIQRLIVSRELLKEGSFWE